MSATMRFCTLAATLPALVGGLTGCGAGALQQSVTGDNCAPGDERCLMAGLGAPLAVGATMTPTVNTRLRGSGAPSLELESASPSVMGARDHTITGVSPGVSALMMTMKDGVVIDFVHVWVAAPTRLQLHRLGPDGSDLGEITEVVELVQGESVRVAPHPYAGAQRLLGEGPAAWHVRPPIASVLHEGSAGPRRLLARAPGAATVTVDSLGLQSTLQLVVHESTDQPDVEVAR